jgi:hypothetical protein
MDDEAPLPPPATKPSLAFSWATLGFILGALFVIALPPRHREPPALNPEPAPVPVEKKLPPLRLLTIEAVFESWGQYAVWNGDVTEVAMYDPDTHDFTACYQVVRSPNGGAYFFRSIARLTQPVLTHGVPGDSPLRYTETAAQREQWLRESIDENWKALHATPTVKAPPPA